HSSSLLEGSRGYERIRRERSLGNTQQQWLSTGRPSVFSYDPFVFFFEPELVHLLLEQEIGVTHFFDPNPAHHLANDDFDVFVVNVHTLESIDLLDFIHQISLQFLLS